jgi:hypothetical protein
MTQRLLQIQRDRLSAADLGLYLIEMVRSKLSAQPKSNSSRIFSNCDFS